MAAVGEERLLVEAAQADPARFAALYDLHFEQVYAFIARRVRDRDTAEDLTSEVFHKALANLKNYEWRGAPFAAWLIRIAANAMADRSKRAAREVACDEDPPAPDVKTVPTAERDLEEIEHRARLFRLVSELPSNQRRVIHQRFVEEKSIREIARQLGRSEGAVKQLQFRALQSLRQQMEGGHA
ncbi:MAG TPA: sigma-70 family RNA polymerase sigma factor [Bryobacteraceae bacterium]|jgi:RNA polymerase sigma-70 factor (ECF subfamily)